MTIRQVEGSVVFPENAPVASGQVADIEVHDISLADAPSEVVARRVIDGVEVAPGGRLPFALEVEEADPRRSLSLRVHVHPALAEHMATGDMLTTAYVPVPSTGTPEPLEVAVQVI